MHISIIRFQYRVSMQSLSIDQAGWKYCPDYLPVPSSQCLKYFWTVAVGSWVVLCTARWTGASPSPVSCVLTWTWISHACGPLNYQPPAWQKASLQSNTGHFKKGDLKLGVRHKSNSSCFLILYWIKQKIQDNLLKIALFWYPPLLLKEGYFITYFYTLNTLTVTHLKHFTQ